MIFPLILFGAPFAALAFEWVVLGVHRRDQLRHITVMMAMIFSTASAALGTWMALHVEQFSRRAPSDYGMEKTGLLLSAISVFAGITWAKVDRNRLSSLALVASGWTFLIWLVICLTA